MYTEFAYDEHMMDEDKQDLAESFMADEETEETDTDEDTDEEKKEEVLDDEDENGL